jgi:uncharacterized protein YdhG (YjbR/CyaY superfamily)
MSKQETPAKEAPKTPADIDAYIRQWPSEIRARLSELRDVVRKAAPHATEKISYQMPTFYYHGNLVHFAAHPRHIGFYPTPSAIVKFQKDLAGYKTSKGAVQFPLEEPLPLSLVDQMVRFRVLENEQKARKTKGKPGKPQSAR